jgi:hypothetical protein
MMEIRSVTRCGITNHEGFERIWSLPNLPLTEMIGPYDKEFSGFDQELLISTRSGHVQLRNQISPEILYTEKKYSFRTGSSQKSNRDILFFNKFLETLPWKNTFESIVDIGGNDLTLAKTMVQRSKKVAVIDPVCKSIDGEIIDGIHVIGKFIEDVNLLDLGKKPDLIVFRHTLEHIANPVQFITQCVEQSAEDCLFICEIPCFDCLMESNRFDAIFHQHYHYFRIDTLKQLISSCECEIVDYSYNHQGSCGGALIIAFKKNQGSIKSQEKVTTNQVEIDRFIDQVKARIKLYQIQMEIMGDLLKVIPKPIFGYGAGLMLSTLGYHLKTDFSNLECILDDDLTKDEVSYINVPIKVNFSGKVAVPSNSSFIITSLENIRPIYKRILELKPRRILSPCLS